MKIIEAVYVLKSPESDTVFNHYRIHGYNCYSLNSLYLQVQTDFPEIQNLANGIIPAGNSDLDYLLKKYQQGNS